MSNRPMLQFDPDDVGAFARDREKLLGNTAYRREYNRRDFFVLNRFQRRLMASKARFVFGQSGNQVGKSSYAAYIVAHLATGTPIPGYNGRPFPVPKIDRTYKRVIWIMAGETGQTAILGLQTRLFGDVISGKIGTGMLPLSCIVKITYQHGVPGLISDAVIRMDDGELAVIRIRTYSQGKEALTSEAVDYIVCDELPPTIALWTELIARLTATDGSLLLAATPGKQQNEIVHWFKRGGPDIEVIRGSLDDAEHISEDQKHRQAELYKQSSDAEYRSRYFGDEFAGGGFLLRFNPKDLVEDIGLNILNSPRMKFIIGIDINHGGLSESAHPHGVVYIAYDADTETFYVTRAERYKGVDFANLAASILQNPIGDAPAAWGHDLNQGIAGTKETFADMMRRLGVNMIATKAAFDGGTGSTSLEPQITLIQDLILRGKLRINSTGCQVLIEEMQGLERDESGKPIPLRDDVFSALRYAVLMAPRFSRTVATFNSSNGLQRSGYSQNGQTARGVNDWNIWDPYADDK